MDSFSENKMAPSFKSGFFHGELFFFEAFSENIPSTDGSQQAFLGEKDSFFYGQERQKQTHLDRSPNSYFSLPLRFSKFLSVMKTNRSTNFKS